MSSLIALSCDIVTGIYFLYMCFQRAFVCPFKDIQNVQTVSEFFKFWVNPSVPTEVGIYFFHILNPYEVQNGGKKIKVKEMGKYMFKSSRSLSPSSMTATVVYFIF